jgi:hypothetical protein
MIRSRKTTPTPAAKPHLPNPFKAYSIDSSPAQTGGCFRCGSMTHRVAVCPEADTRINTSTGLKSSCGHCGRAGHTAEKCFHLHGFPSKRTRSRSPGRKHLLLPGPPSIRAAEFDQSPARSPRDS